MIPVMETFLRARAEGRTVAPPRHAVDFGAAGKLVFTIGDVEDAARSLAGFRVYDTFPISVPVQSGQLVAVWDSGTGALLGVILGDLLGEWRTGALGGVAIRRMARAGAKICAVLGTGRQARTQLLAAVASRELAEIRVFGRDEARRAGFMHALSAETGKIVRPSRSAREAVEGADIVLCATNSPTPVFDAAWLAPRVHVSSVGPKLRSAHELPLNFGARVTLLVSDSPEQLSAYREPHVISGHAMFDRLPIWPIWSCRISCCPHMKA